MVQSEFPVAAGRVDRPELLAFSHGNGLVEARTTVGAVQFRKLRYVFSTPLLEKSLQVYEPLFFRVLVFIDTPPPSSKEGIVRSTRTP